MYEVCCKLPVNAKQMSCPFADVSWQATALIYPRCVVLRFDGGRFSRTRSRPFARSLAFLGHRFTGSPVGAKRSPNGLKRTNIGHDAPKRGRNTVKPRKQTRKKRAQTQSKLGQSAYQKSPSQNPRNGRKPNNAQWKRTQTHHNGPKRTKANQTGLKRGENKSAKRTQTPTLARPHQNAVKVQPKRSRNAPKTG